MTKLRSGGVLLILGLLCSREALAVERPVERFAIVIGNNRSLQPESPDLRYADDDAVATHQLLQAAAISSRLLVSPDADTQRLFGAISGHAKALKAELERTFSELAVRMREASSRGSDTEFLLFYSGHGDVEGGEGYVALEDGKLTRSMLFGLLERSPATRNHVFVDACKSYFLAFDRGPGGQRTPFAGGLTQSIPAKLANTGFILSTSSDRDSHEWERYQGGILSHELRSALRGAADANLDGSISYAEVGAFLDVANRSIENSRFRPDVLVSPPKAFRERPILSWNPKRPTLSFGAGSWGHLYVENRRGDRLVDAHPAPNQPLSIWAPDERPLFVRRNDGRAEYILLASESVQVLALTPSEPELARRGALSVALDHLFDAPFSQADVLRFRPAQPDPPPPVASDSHKALKIGSGVIAIAAAVGGLALNGMAYATYASSAGESQQTIRTMNETSARFNRASFACYAVAAIAGVTWGVVTFGQPSAPKTATVSSNVAPGFGATLDVRTQF